MTLMTTTCALLFALLAPPQDNQKVPNDHVILEFYDVRDLFATTEEAESGAESMLATIRENIQPPLEEGSTELRFHSGALICRATLPQQQWVAQFLKTQRQRPEMVFIESHLFTVSEKDFARLGLNGGNLLLETRAEVDGLLKRLQEDLQADLLGAPKVLVMPRQKTELSVLNQSAYIKDWQVERVIPGDRLIADPVVDHIAEGQEVQYWLYPVGKRSFSVDLSFEQSKIQRPIPTITTPLEGFGPVEVAVPTVHKTKISCRLMIPDGAGALFSGPSLKNGYVQGVLFVVNSMKLEEGRSEKGPVDPVDELLRRRKDG